MTEKPEQHKLFTALAGSRAHGMETATSDVDHRSAIVVPTGELLRFGASGKLVKDMDRSVDENAWELERFLHLALNGNPNVLEALVAPVVTSTSEGDELRSLFPRLLQRHKVHGAFSFARSQKYGFAKPVHKRLNKAATHYLRVLYNGLELLRTGTMTVRVIDTDIGPFLMRVKLGEEPLDKVIATGSQLESEYEEALATSPLPLKGDIEAINDFYLRVRKAHW